MTPAAAYRYSTAAVPRSFGGPSAVGPPPCGMVAARPRHDQGPASVFSSAGMALQSEYFDFLPLDVVCKNMLISVDNAFCLTFNAICVLFCESKSILSRK